MSNEDSVENYYDSIAEGYSDQYNIDNLKSGKKYPQNLFRLNIILKRMEEIGVKTVYEVGVGEGTPLLRMAEQGYAVAGCDISANMVQQTQAKLAPKGVPETHILKASIEQSDFADTLPGTYDSVVALGVMPHVRDDSVALKNMASALNPGGRLFIEFRNKLFSLFTFNRFTKEFILDDLLAPVPDDIKAHVAAELDQRVATDLPPVRENKKGTSYDRILAKSHNPFEVPDLLGNVGFGEVKIHWYHFHSAMPMLEREDRVGMWQAAAAMEYKYASDWRGYFLCSAMLIEATYGGRL